jgi:hypothetical protein
MRFLLSGEGPSDIGACSGGNDACEVAEFEPGPMAVIVDQIVERQHNYSPLGAGVCMFVSKRLLSRRATELKDARKSLGLPGRKRAKETRYFFNNSRVLARMAIDESAERGDEVVAVLFRDSDGTASAGRGLWDEKRRSMLQGFDEEEFGHGVPMIPKPKSEAWLICAVKQNPYQNCDALEGRSGNDRSPNSLKKELREILGGDVTPLSLCERMRNDFDIDKIAMSSFTTFRKRLEDVI